MTTDRGSTGWRRLRQQLREQWWIHPLIATALTVVLNDIARPWPQLGRAFAMNLGISVCIATATTAVYVLGWRAHPLQGGPLRRALVHGISIVVGVLVGTELVLLVLRAVTSDIDLAAAREGIWRVGLVVTAVMVTGSLSYDRLREHVRAVELREQLAQHALVQAQLESLEARVNPHFLFNALNTVASLVEDEPEHAIEAIERLSLLLRRSLESVREGQVALRCELETVQGYLALERLRFGERLRHEVLVGPELEAVLVPAFVLQPLVENAVKHGIASRREGGLVRVVVAGDAAQLHIVVEDDGSGRSRAPGTRSGNELLRRRLALLYGADATFAAGPHAGGWRVSLSIPRSKTSSAAALEAGRA